MNSADSRTELIPDAARKPLAVLLTWIVPQLILLFFNVRSCWLAFGEMSVEQQRLAGGFLGMGVALLLGGIGYAIYLHRTGRMISLLASAFMLASHIAYLWIFVGVVMDQLLPSSVTLWIVPPETVLFHQFTFIMPAVFYAGLRLACFPLRAPRGTDVGLTLLAAVGIPVVFYTLFHILGRIAGRYMDRLAGELVFLFFVAFTAVMVMGLLRLTALMYRGVSAWGDRGLMVLGVLVGLVGPIAGLQLNRSIPFPVDFQSFGVYVLAIINGLAVTLPRPRTAGPGAAIWLLQCATFPFTFYFFIVFLPFLPLSLLAVIALGAGILMLVPTMLFALHTFRLVDGFKAARARTSAPVAVLLLVAALSAMPAFVTGQALVDRAVIRKAVHYVYEADAATSEFHGSLPALRRTLLHMRDRHYGLELPYLSGYYDWLVFNGLTLSEEKIGRLYRIFFGTEIGEPRTNFDARLFGGGRPRNMGFGRRLGSPPPTSALLTNVSVSTRTEGRIERATAVLDMVGGDAWQSECVVAIQVPAGVQVSGYWLHIGPDRVPGQLFEKKTAMWVYQMIRDSERRDPGLMVYKDPGTLELRVFPFTNAEHRVTEIEFSYPSGLAPVVAFNERRVDLAPGPEAHTAFITPVDGAGAEIVIPEKLKESLPRTDRRPYFHFILDRSSACAATLEEQLAVAARIAMTDPAIDRALVTIADFASRDLAPDLTSVNDLRGLASSAEDATPRGGLFLDRAVERALLDFERRCADPAHGEEWATRYPRIVVIEAAGTVSVSGGDLSLAARSVPDVNGYEVYNGAELKNVTAWNGAPISSIERQSVAVMKLGHAHRALAVDRPGPVGFRVPDDSVSGDVSVYDPAAASWTTVPAERVPRDAAYAAGVRAWLAYDALALHPTQPEQQLKDLVELSRTCGVMVPSTAYIVVENSAQWKMLALKEQQKLETSSAFHFKETPEPATWAMLAAAGGMIVLFHGLRRRRAVCAWPGG